MYVENGGPGFWVCRTTWGKTVARVVGATEFKGNSPYFKNPTLLIDIYSLLGEIKDELAIMSAPGTYKTWQKIDQPDWANNIALRPLNDPKIAGELSLC